MNRLTHDRLAIVGCALVLLGVVNLAAFACGSLCLGGTADAGKIAEGSYFVGNHGSYRQVSRAAYAYSQIHSASLVVTHPLAMGAFLVVFWLARHPPAA